ncbi:MAG: MotA/TolQ/ExbB proton channel family protein [Bdellovibrionales bacterium]|nr:MotA/TolQ/ExbB proton channel family protein [Bdellovibrionales bacterium]
MKKLFLTLTIISISLSTFATESLDDLLKQVKQDQVLQQKENLQREQEFLTRKEKQKELLKVAQSELKIQEAITAKLLKEFEDNEKSLSKLEEQLTIATGTLGELFGVVRQVSGDFRGQLQNSVISAQYPGREKFMEQLAEAKSLPGINDLEGLWFEIQKEMTESGKIVIFAGSVVLPDGSQKQSPITRVGSFNLVANGNYLSYEPEAKQIVELPRQPSGRYLSMISDLKDSKTSANAFALDPSRGTILGMLINTPSLSERVNQGGLIGYIILALLAIGMGLVIERWVVLKREGEKMAKQLTSDQIELDNPIGKLLKTYEDNKGKDLEALEVKLDEVIIRSLPKLKRGIGTIKILSAVAPLLGLLGTVTGMILTFQSITLFGTGDPKLMAGGISQALITTVLGLVCAIPLLLLHNFIAGKSKRLVQILEEQSAGLIASKMEGEKA